MSPTVFQIRLQGDNAFRDLPLTLNVSNVFDTDPPLYLLPNLLQPSNGYTNGSTVGRLVQIGFAKRF